jgi:hypothetical protein
VDPRVLNLNPSTNVRGAVYDSDTQQLSVEFFTASGFYSGVSEDEALEFERSPSPGRYVHDYLKTRFPWTKIA